MKKHISIKLALILCFILIISGCSKVPITNTLEVETQVVLEVTEARTPEITATPTETPPIPCTIAFESNRDGNREIYHMAPDGSNTVNLSNNPADDFKPAISADGSKIAFDSNREAGEEGDNPSML